MLRSSASVRFSISMTVGLRLLASASARLPSQGGGSNCVLQDGFECVRTPGCGWCAYTYTCMFGDAEGPAEGSLRCNHTATGQPLPQNYVGPDWTFTEEALNATGYPGVQHIGNSAPADWDNVCDYGGMRTWANCTGCYGTKHWGLQRCDCPAGRNGITCGGCASSAGCLSNETCDFNLRGETRGASMVCNVADAFPPLIKDSIDRFTDGGVLAFDYTPLGGLNFRLSQAVENPAWVGITFPAGGFGDRIYSGTTLKANVSAVLFEDDLHCPAQPSGLSVKYPWRAGDSCMRWTLAKSDTRPEEQMIECANTSADFRAGGWDRYRDACDLLKGPFQLPIVLQCTQLQPGASNIDCVIQMINTQVSLSLQCEVEGTCMTVPNPPSPPSSPAYIAASCFDASSEHHDFCWRVFSYSFIFVSLLAAILFPFSIFFCCRLFARLRWSTACASRTRALLPSLPFASRHARPQPWDRFRLTSQPLLDVRPPTEPFPPHCATASLSGSGRIPGILLAGDACSVPRPAAEHSHGLPTRRVDEKLEQHMAEAVAPAPQPAMNAVLHAAPSAAPPSDLAPSDSQTTDFSPSDSLPSESPRHESLSSELALASHPSTRAQPGLQLHWQAVSYRIRRKQIVQSCSHRLDAGLTCLIGPSGAGKSSLLGVLAGRKRRGAIGGRVLLNGEETSAATRRQLIGYVTQDDLLPGTSTIREHLVFHATVRCHWLDPAERNTMVLRTLKSLQLEHKANQRIGDAHMRGLSGGERRRVSVAVELMVLSAGLPRSRNESYGGGLLLMDEPLSGLDSVNARLVLEALCNLARAAGVGGAEAPSVLLSVHQPTHRFLEEMNGVVVMANGGRLLYAGPRLLPGGSCALSAHFDSAGAAPRLCEVSPNPAEALLEALADSSPEMCQRVEVLIERQQAADTVCSRASVSIKDSKYGLRRSAAQREAGFVVQFAALSERHCTLALRHPLLIWVNLGTVLLISVLSGVAFWQNGRNFNLDTGVLQRIGLLFFLMLVFTLTGLINITMWHQERLLYFHERGASCYGPLAYLCSKAVYDLVPLRVVPSFLCAAIVYPMAGLRSDGPHSNGGDAIGPAAAFLFAIGLALANCVGYTMFNAIGIACRSSTIGVQLAVLLALYSFLFCGLLVNRSALEALGAQLGWLQNILVALPYTSFAYHFLELVLVNELAAPPVPPVTIIQRPIPGVPKVPPTTVEGTNILGFLGFATGDLPGEHCWLSIPCSTWDDIEVLAVWLVVSQILCYILLRFFVVDPH